MMTTRMLVARPHPFGRLQRKCTCGGSASGHEECEACGKKRLARRSSTSDALVSLLPQSDSGAPTPVHSVLNSAGQPLESKTRMFMEQRFGHDFGGVRIHADKMAAAAAASVSAHAFTVGEDIAFAEDQYRPSTAEGRRLIAHELTHVVQQRNGAGRSIGRQATASPTSARLLRIIAEIERIKARAGAHPANEEANAFVERLRTVANGSDEALKVSVLAAFSNRGIQQAEAQLPRGGNAVRQRTPVRLAQKSLEVSHPGDASEIEADRVADAVVTGGAGSIGQTVSEGRVSRQAGAALVAAGAGILVGEGESLPVTSWNPPGWVILGVATVAALALIGIGYAISDTTTDTTTDESDPCAPRMAACMLTSLADLPGSVYGQGRCVWCAEVCRRNGGQWPTRAPSPTGSVRCDYWNFRRK